MLLQKVKLVFQNFSFYETLQIILFENVHTSCKDEIPEK